jgi:hypothetical protein
MVKTVFWNFFSHKFSVTYVRNISSKSYNLNVMCIVCKILIICIYNEPFFINVKKKIRVGVI